MGKLEIDFNKAIRQAEQLEGIANELKRISNNNMESIINNISANWQCSSSSEFCNKGRVVKGNISDTATQLQNIANSIRRIAKRTYDAEKRIQEIANSRTYKG